MKAKTVEELIYTLESYEADYLVAYDNHNGKPCISILAEEPTALVDRIYLTSINEPY